MTTITKVPANTLTFGEQVARAKCKHHEKLFEFTPVSMNEMHLTEYRVRNGLPEVVADVHKQYKKPSVWTRSTEKQRIKAKRKANKALAQIDIPAIQAKYQEYKQY